MCVSIGPTQNILFSGLFFLCPLWTFEFMYLFREWKLKRFKLFSRKMRQVTRKIMKPGKDKIEFSMDVLSVCEKCEIKKVNYTCRVWFIEYSNWLHFGSWILTLHFRVQWNNFRIWQDGGESRSSTLVIIHTVIWQMWLWNTVGGPEQSLMNSQWVVPATVF